MFFGSEILHKIFVNQEYFEQSIAISFNKFYQTESMWYLKSANECTTVNIDGNKNQILDIFLFVRAKMMFIQFECNSWLSFTIASKKSLKILLYQIWDSFLTIKLWKSSCAIQSTEIQNSNWS